MTRNGIIVLATLMVSLVVGWHARVVAAEDPQTPVFKTDRPIQVDGKLDEPAWQRAAPVEAKYILGKKGQIAKDPHLTAKYTWDEFYLYIAYEVYDSNLVAIAGPEKQGPPGRKRQGLEISVPGRDDVDVVEFFITFGDPNLFWEIHHNAGNQFNDVLVVTGLPDWKTTKPAYARYGIYFGKEEYIQDDGQYQFSMAVQMKPRKDGNPSTVNSDQDTDTGYTAELRLPWLGIGAPLRALTVIETRDEQGNKIRKPGPWKIDGEALQILAVIQDGDGKDRYHHSCPNLPGGFFHVSAEHYPRYLLVTGENTAK